MVNQSGEKKSALLWGLLFGMFFGFFLHKGGATKYNVILGQLLLTDFTVVKIMLSAVVTGMIGIYLMKAFGWVELHPKSGTLWSSILGGLLFGIGFALLGYCPGTIAGAMGNGYLDAVFGGVAGIIIGAGLYAVCFPKIKNGLLGRAALGDITLPRLLKVNEWFVILPVGALIILLLRWLEISGL
jgi:hypothetical protein